MIEHDTLISPDTLPWFERCPEPWCVDGCAFECVRFRGELLQRHADLFEDPLIEELKDNADALQDGEPLRWDLLSNTVDLALYARGARTHMHEPRSAWHLNAKARDRRGGART